MQIPPNISRAYIWSFHFWEEAGPGKKNVPRDLLMRTVRAGFLVSQTPSHPTSTPKTIWLDGLYEVLYVLWPIANLVFHTSEFCPPHSLALYYRTGTETE